ncbi:sodium solute symporter [Aureococcus anophagefferens]|nr:sodium solute symporter [Aureococcus anophagefferens]
MSNRRQSVASQLQSERDCRRWAGWMNGRLEGAIAAAELAAIGAEEFAARLRSGVVLWMLLETFADPKELLPAGRQAPRGLREGRRRHREPSRIEAVDNLNCVFGALARLGVNHTGIGPLDVADAKTELVLGLVWSIVAHVVARERGPVLLWARASAEESPLSAATIVPRLLRDLDDAARAALDGRGDLAGAGVRRAPLGRRALFDADDANVDERCLVAYLAELKKRVEAERGGAAEPAPARAPEAAEAPEAAGPWEAVLGGWRDRARRGGPRGAQLRRELRRGLRRGRRGDSGGLAAAAGDARQPAGAATAGDVWDGLRRDAALVKAVAAAAANASRRAVAADEAARRAPPPPPPPPRAPRRPGRCCGRATRSSRRATTARSSPRRPSPRPRRPSASAAPRVARRRDALREDRDAAVAAAAARASRRVPRRREGPRRRRARRSGGARRRVTPKVVAAAVSTAVDAAIAEERRAAAAALAAATDSVRTEERTAGLAALQELADGHRAEKRAAIEAAAARLGAKHGEALRLMQSQAEEAIAKSRDDALAEAAEAPPPQSPGLPDEHASSAALAKLAEASEGTVAYSAAAFAALKTTMEYLKGHAVSLHRRESSKLLKALDRADDGVARAKLFKHAHLKVKEVVVRVTRSNQRSGRHWEPFHGDASFATVQPHELALILTHLRNLAVAYDNMTADEKRELTTVRELVVNLDWLCALAKHCVASDERRYADRERRLDREPRARVDRAGDGAAPPAPPSPRRNRRRRLRPARRRRRPLDRPSRCPTRGRGGADVAGPRPAPPSTTVKRELGVGGVGSDVRGDHGRAFGLVVPSP